jgi:hypothetical protein
MGVSPLGIQLSGLRSMVASIDIDGIYVFLSFCNCQFMFTKPYGLNLFSWSFSSEPSCFVNALQ